MEMRLESSWHPCCDQESEQSEMAGEKSSWAGPLTLPLCLPTLPFLGSVKTVIPQDGSSLGFSSSPREKPP